MTEQPLLSATLIARDEKHNVRRCLDSIWPWVDEVVVVDTGSTDGTMQELKRYARERERPDKLKLSQFFWQDDFAAARQHADDQATGRWVTWCDMDDTVEGLSKLREMARDATDEVQAFFAVYSYAQDETGNTVSELWRERVVRKDAAKWAGRLHEHKIFTGGTVVKVPPDVARWVHHRDHTVRTAERNLRILEAWLEAEPENPRVLSSMALEFMGDGQHKRASDTFERFLDMEGEPQDRRCQAFRHLCVMLMVQGRAEEARRQAFRALEESWLWADTHLSLAETAQTLDDPQAGFMHARQALELGKPDTLLIVNPLQYTAHPRALMAVCCAQLGDFEQAVKLAGEVLEIAPAYGLVTSNLPLWRGHLQKQHALGAFLACEKVLSEHGELVKARLLLDQAPWFIAEDPQIVKRRGEVVRVLEERVRARPALVEDEAADKFVQRHEQEALA